MDFMQHATDEELILEYYGEPEVKLSDHLAVCLECRARFAALQRTLNAVDLPVPHKPPAYEEAVWLRVAPALGMPVRERSRRWWQFGQREWLTALAMACVAVLAFLIGREARPPMTPVEVRVEGPAPIREGVLVSAVGDHLERSEFVLAELLNTEPGGGDRNIAGERVLAENLLMSNRLYRQTATAAGRTGMVALLEDLERVLLEISHSPDSISPGELEMLRRRVEEQHLLFKVRIVGSKLREQLEESASEPRQEEERGQKL
jgi:hypothetical protein